MTRNPKWLILILAGVTNALAIAAPGMSLPVLFKEISQDLSLSLVQVGVIWGISSLPGIITSLLGGAITDRLGPKRSVVLGTILVGITGALRGLSNDFAALLITVFISGLMIPLINMSGIKSCSIWFPKTQRALAMGILSMGMALGFLLGSFLSATFLSPWLGGWRNIMFFYGAISLVLTIPWVFTPSPSLAPYSTQATTEKMGMTKAIGQIVRLRNIWLLGFGMFGMGGAIQAALGYIPLYLRNLGWTSLNADGALSAFHFSSLIMVLPIALLSDRLGDRKRIVFIMSLMIITGIGLLSIASGPAVWFAVILSGMVRDGFMALFITMIMETEGVGPGFAGTATGFVMIFSMTGSMIAPPIGNTLAAFYPGLPFLFWAILAAFGLVCITLTRSAHPVPLHPKSDPLRP